MALDVAEEILDRLEQRVVEVEEGTTAEVVVVLAHRSGSYRDAAALWGVGVGLSALLLLMVVPVGFWEGTVMALTLVAGLAGSAIAARQPFLLRLLSSRARQRGNVRRRARAAFFDEAVSATRERTGLLVFYSLLEDTVEVLTDHGLDARIAKGTWNTIVAEATEVAGPGRWEHNIDELLARCTPILAERFPCTEDNPNEISNRPRVLL